MAFGFLPLLRDFSGISDFAEVRPTEPWSNSGKVITGQKRVIVTKNDLMFKEEWKVKWAKKNT